MSEFYACKADWHVTSKTEVSSTQDDRSDISPRNPLDVNLGESASQPTLPIDVNLGSGTPLKVQILRSDQFQIFSGKNAARY